MDNNNNEDEFAKALNNLSDDAGATTEGGDVPAGAEKQGGDFFADNNNTSYLDQSGGEASAGGGASWQPRSVVEQFDTSGDGAAPADAAPLPEPVAEPAFSSPEPAITPTPTPAPSGGGGLTDLKTSVLTDLRPVIDNIEIVPDEKFTLLSTLFKANKDSTIIEPAYNAAKEISDDTKRAEALLDIVRDIDSVN